MIACQTDGNIARVREIIASAKFGLIKGPRAPLVRIKRAFWLVRDHAKSVAKMRRGKQGLVEDAVNTMTKEESELLLRLTEGKHPTHVNWQVVARYFQSFKPFQLRTFYLFMVPRHTKG